ncbi:MAG: alanine racemase, partial [Candidatus Omnitrophica bacterium]|nr:alanine racemase [Candidatus Omnitrophota bacterium]
MTELTVKTRNGVSRPRYRPTWAEVSLVAIEYNYKQVRRLVGKSIDIMVVVKANAYGHG